ncbi:MAG: serine/threonine-protein kinase [Planctomycetota bacterium]
MTDAIERLVAEYIERREDGEPIEAATFAAEHPEHAKRLLEAIVQLEVTEALFPSVQRPPLERVGPYRLSKEIGRGGMGRVFEAVHDERPHQVVALKILDPAFVLDPRAASRFRREGRILAKLSHEGIVRVHEVDLASGTPYLVMDRIVGTPLQELLVLARQRTDPGPRCVRLGLSGSDDPYRAVALTMSRVARAVQAAHDAGLLHRDLKPANVIVDDAGHPILVDFGLARGEATRTLTRPGDVLGTPRYMAPEQIRGAEATVRSDVFGLGAILHELLTLEPPHGDLDSVALWRLMQNRTLVPVQRRERGIPRPLETIVARATAFRPERRTASAAALAADLEAFAEGRPVTARPFGAVERGLDLWRVRRVAIVVTMLVVVASGLGLWIGLESGAAPDIVDLEPLRRAAVIAWLEDDRDELGRLGQQIVNGGGSELGDVLIRAASSAPISLEADGLLRGEAARRSGDWPAAVSAFEDALAGDPSSPFASALLGEAAWRARRWELADRELENAVRSTPESSRLWYALADTRYELESYEGALEAIEHAIAIEPSRYPIHLRRAQILYRLDRGSEALEAAERARKHCEEEPLPTKLLDTLAVLYSQAERREEARGIWRELLEQRPGRTKYRYDIALSYDAEDDFEAAATAYRDVLARDPNHVQSLANLAFLYAGSKRETCEQCREYFEGHPEMLDHGKAEQYALEAVRASEGASEQALWVATEVARRAGWPPEIEETIEGLLLDADPSQEKRVLLLQRYLKQLRDRR